MGGLARLGAVLSTLPLLCGCFHYLPAPLESIPPGEEVRVHVTRAGLDRVPEDLPGGRSFLSGQVVGLAADSLVLRVPITQRGPLPGTLQLRQDYHIPRGEIVEVERREVSRARTALSFAAVAGGATALVLLIIEGSGSSDGGPDEGPDQMRLPIFAIPLR